MRLFNLPKATEREQEQNRRVEILVLDFKNTLYWVLKSCNNYRTLLKTKL